KLDLGINGGIACSAFGLRAYFETGERLALLAQNAIHVGGGAPTKRNQHQFHRTIGSLVLGRVHNYWMSRRGLPDEAFVVSPPGSGFHHDDSYLRLSVLG